MGEVRFSNRLQKLFEEARNLQEVKGVVSNNLEYILALEYGHSLQAPDGMVRRRKLAHDYMLQEEVAHAFKASGSIQRAMEAGVASATLRVMRDVSDATPVDTGRAKNAWTATLPNGRQVQAGTTISEQQQRVISAARRRADTTRRQKDRAKAARILKRQSRRST